MRQAIIRRSLNKRMYYIQLLIACGLSVQAVVADMRFNADPPDAQHPWAVHDANRPQPPTVTPGVACGRAPSDALVLFDGTKESFQAHWQHLVPEDKRKSDWVVVDGALQCVGGSGYIGTKELFGDIQLHIEWAAPAEGRGNGQQRGNSGVFLLGLIEVQILDNYQNPTYADGTAGSIYGLMPPAVNALNPPGVWQSYDIIFRRPITRNGEVQDPGSMTVLCNGVVVQDHVALNGGGGWRERKSLERVFPESGRLTLQDHGNPVRYRNIWVRPLRSRALDGGFDGLLSTEATQAKRVETAAGLREKAAGLTGVEKALVLLESLIYAEDTNALKDSDALVASYLEAIQSLSEVELDRERGRVLRLKKAYAYLIQHDFLAADHFALSNLTAIIEANWPK
jgi:hypothetical protein